ncbi:hypothetical protein ABR759_00610 [Escherichia coli]
MARSTDCLPSRSRKKFRSLGSAIINSGMAFGIALGLMTSSWLVYDRGYSRRMPFLCHGDTFGTGRGCYLALCEREKRTADAEGKPVQKGKFSDLLKNRNLILTYIMVFCSLFGFFVILTRLPYYLQKRARYCR